MSRPFLEIERSEHRVLGALSFHDAATGREIAGAMSLTALDGKARFVRNRSGLHVLWSWSELEEHAGAFLTPPAVPAVGASSLPLEVQDPLGRYLPRRVSVRLPRNPDPALREDPDSLFQPVRVPMYRAPASPTGTNWAVVRATVVDQGSGDGLGGAVLRLVRGGEVIARGLTDGRGDGVVPVVGIPMLTFGTPDADDDEDDGAVVVDTVAATVEAVFSPGAGSRMSAAGIAAGAAPPIPLVDPDAVETAADAETAQAPLDLGARRTVTVTLPVELP